MSEHPVYDAILARRSIRAFTDKPVARQDAARLLTAAMAAPSACNLQPWSFIVVDEPQMLAKLKASTEQGQYSAPLCIVVCGTGRHIPWEGDGWLLDCGMAIQNILLTAQEMGIASVCVGSFDEDALRGLLNIPADTTPVCIVELGYPACARPPLSWYTDEAVHDQSFDPEKPRRFRTLEALQEDIRKGII